VIGLRSSNDGDRYVSGGWEGRGVSTELHKRRGRSHTHSLRFCVRWFARRLFRE
jgi:hypothetical protein